MGARRATSCCVLACVGVMALGVLGAEDPLKVEAIQDTTISWTKGDAGGDNSSKHPAVRLMTGDEKHRIVMQFEFKDLAARPCAAAILRLVTDKCWINEKVQYIRVHRLVRPFLENRATWKMSWDYDSWINPGGDCDPTAACVRKLVKTDGGEGKVIEFNVTPLVQGWQAKAFPNYGLLLTLDEGSDMNVHFHSRKSADVDKHPQLLLYYAATPPKISEMFAASTLKPLGAYPQMKVELMSQGQSKGNVGADFKSNFYARGGIAPYTFKATGLPDGLTLTPAGAIEGKPTKVGTFKVNVTAEGADRKGASLKQDIVIAEPAPKEPVAAGDRQKPADGAAPVKKPDKKPEEE